MDRTFTPTEKIYLSAEKIAPPFAIQMIIEGEGAILTKDLYEAVKKVSDVYPGTRLQLCGKKWIAGKHYPRVREIESEYLDKALMATFQPREGITAEVLIVRMSSQQIKLVFRALHSVMDGKGVLIWIEEVFKALRNEPLRGATSVETEREFLQRSPVIYRRKKLKLNFVAPIDLAHGNRYHCIHMRKTLIGNHAALVSKLATLLTAESKQHKALFMVPVDLRRHDEQLHSTANLSLPIFLECNKEESWEVIHERLLVALKKNHDISCDGTESMMSRMPLSWVTSVLRALINWQQMTGKFPVTSILSHLGRIEFSSFSCADFIMRTLYSIPVYVPIVPLSFVAVDCVDHTELMVSCPAGDTVKKHLEKLWDKIDILFNAESSHYWPANNTHVSFSQDKTVIDLFKEQVTKNPEAIALWDHGKKISYRELDQQSDIVAHELILKGISSGDVVAVLLDRTYYALYAMMGILKTGAAFLPVDPQYPSERINYFLNDSQTVICITQKDFVPILVKVEFHRFIVVENLSQELVTFSVRTNDRSDEFAYVIYTSGSTGLPKGVRVGHRSLVNYLEWAKSTYQVHPDSRFAFFTSIAFDLSITSFLLPLISGASVALFFEQLDHVLLHDVLINSGVNSLKITPTHLELILKLNLKIKPNQLRVVVVGGEQLKGSTANLSQEIFGTQCQIINEYGPTEATVGCVYHIFDSSKNQEVVPIGIPIQNTQIYLLNSKKQPVNVDEIGELYIVGDCLALDYLNRHELTQEKFTDILDRDRKSVRAYRTGDLGRLKNGILEYIGRNDEQIKIRGQRVELGEIEAVIENGPGILKAIVLARYHPVKEEKILCAYVIAEESFQEEKLNQFLLEKLPQYMIPTLIEKIDDIPLTVNGKIDVHALPMNWGAVAVENNAFNDSDILNDEERLIANIWAFLLKVNANCIHLDSDFYDLGGDSLKMIEMLSQVTEQVIGKERELLFMQNARMIIRKPLLRNVCVYAKQSLSQGMRTK